MARTLKLRRLLSLPPQHAPLRPEALQRSEDGDVVIEDLRFRAERDIWAPASVVKPRNASPPRAAIICLPGTNGTRQHLTAAQLQLSPRPHTGWARARARRLSDNFARLSRLRRAPAKYPHRRPARTTRRAQDQGRPVEGLRQLEQAVSAAY